MLYIHLRAEDLAKRIGQALCCWEFPFHIGAFNINKSVKRMLWTIITKKPYAAVDRNG